MNAELSRIIDEYWKNFVEIRDEDFVVKPSIPIIWFGDMDAYMKSKLKVVTVALNPSDREFCENKGDNPTFFRFPEGKGLYTKKMLSGSDKQVLYKTLSDYYKCNPYDHWFNCFEKPLNYIDASYKTGTNIAIHIDIYTAVATNPTWGKLTKSQKDKVSSNKNHTLNTFRDFVDFLSPDVILYSANKGEMKKAFGFDLEQQCSQQYVSARGFTIETYKYKNTLIIYGRNNYGMPFRLKDEFVKEKMTEISKSRLQGGFMK